MIKVVIIKLDGGKQLIANRKQNGIVCRSLFASRRWRKKRGRKEENELKRKMKGDKQGTKNYKESKTGKKKIKKQKR